MVFWLIFVSCFKNFLGFLEQLTNHYLPNSNPNNMENLKKIISTKWQLEEYQMIFLKIINVIYENYDHPLLTRKEYDIIKQILFEGKSPKECGERFDLTGERIKQIFRKGIIKIMVNIEGLHNSSLYSQKLLEENELLKKENAWLKESINPKANSTSSGNNSFLQKRIGDIDFSVRTYNCLRAQEPEVDTISDLIKLSKSDLLKLRNFGTKSLGEIEELLASEGLTLKSRS